tara:strand:+ start:136407 stop:138323 length:1917 start_codon:yes stop_codon:yes gene_type:complete
MKKVILFTSFCLATLVASAQDLISKIPSTASAVVSIHGKNITELVSTSEFENSKIGKLVLKEMNRKTDGKVTSLETLGIDVKQNFYYFLEAEKGVFTHCVLIPLKNKAGFLNLISRREREKIITEKNVSYFTDHFNTSVTMWNDDTLLVVFLQDKNKENDYSYDNYGYDVESAMEEAIEPVYEEAEEVVMEAVEAEEEEMPVVSEEYIEETVIESTASDYDYNDDYYKKQEEKRKEREAKREEKRKRSLGKVIEKAKIILAGNYANGSILKNSAYVKSIGTEKDEATFWVNDFGSIYDQALPVLLGGMNNQYQMFNFKRLYGGMSLTSKLHFEESKASIKTLYTMNDEMASYNRDMYNGKMNSNFFKYFNEDQVLGYFAINMSTEGILKTYPKMMETMFAGVEKEHFEDIIPIATRLFSVLLDEEAIAKIIRGDMLFVMNGIQNREVTYTTYEYDENYESTEVTKTKNETMPNFLFMVTSEEKEIFDRLMRIGIKEGVINVENGIYQVKIPDVPFSLNMIFKDNALLIGNSAKDLMAIQNRSFNAKVSRKHKKLIAKNSTSIYVNGKQVVTQIPEDFVPRAFQQKLNYISNNVEDVTFRVGKMKGNVMEGEMIFNTPIGKGHKNSLAYFLNMIDVLVD